jgi:hypothetical protein
MRDAGIEGTIILRSVRKPAWHGTVWWCPWTGKTGERESGNSHEGDA